MKTTGIVDALQNVHNSAAEAAKQNMPEIDATELLDLMMSVVKEEKTPQQAARILETTYNVPIKAYLDTFERVGKRQAVDFMLANVKNEGLQNLADSDFSDHLVIAAERASAITRQYYAGKITGAEYLSQLWDNGLKEVGLQAAKASSVDFKNLADSCVQLMNMSVEAVAYAAAAEAFRILMQAIDEATAQHIETARIQQECRRSVELIRQYRTEMEETVSKYMSEHIQGFEAGFNAMDQAILEHDTDGYLKGNAEIQKILGHEAQFETKDEFDDLMNSDTAFKL